MVRRLTLPDKYSQVIATISSQCGEYEENCQGKQLLYLGGLTHTMVTIAADAEGLFVNLILFI